MKTADKEVFSIGDTVVVFDWGKQYGEGLRVFPWVHEIPPYVGINYFVGRDSTPRLTLKGVPYKSGEKVYGPPRYDYKKFSYVILEMCKHPSNGRMLCLLKSKEGCMTVVDTGGISKFSLEEIEKARMQEESLYRLALEKENLGKWSKDMDFKKDFPKELLKYLYDENQNVLFGDSMTKGIVKYPYIEAKYTVNNIPLLLGWEIDYNGKGCDLKGKETTNWSKLKKMFTENVFIA